MKGCAAFGSAQLLDLSTNLTKSAICTAFWLFLTKTTDTPSVDCLHTSLESSFSYFFPTYNPFLSPRQLLDPRDFESELWPCARRPKTYKFVPTCLLLCEKAKLSGHNQQQCTTLKIDGGTQLHTCVRFRSKLDPKAAQPFIVPFSYCRSRI